MFSRVSLKSLGFTNYYFNLNGTRLAWKGCQDGFPPNQNDAERLLLRFSLSMTNNFSLHFTFIRHTISHWRRRWTILIENLQFKKTWISSSENSRMPKCCRVSTTYVWLKKNTWSWRLLDNNQYLSNRKSLLAKYLGISWSEKFSLRFYLGTSSLLQVAHQPRRGGENGWKFHHVQNVNEEQKRLTKPCQAKSNTC